MLLAAWGNGNIFMDVNGDGKVDGLDLAQLQAAWGAYTMARNVPAPVAPPATIPANNSVRTQNKRL
jgi:hypothetical protein